MDFVFDSLIQIEEIEKKTKECYLIHEFFFYYSPCPSGLILHEEHRTRIKTTTQGMKKFIDIPNFRYQLNC